MRRLRMVLITDIIIVLIQLILINTMFLTDGVGIIKYSQYFHYIAFIHQHEGMNVKHNSYYMSVFQGLHSIINSYKIYSNSYYMPLFQYNLKEISDSK